MFNIEEWISDFSQKIQENFKSRIEFIGLQGSYAREEATEGSDIDVVVIFDKLKMDDLKKYDEIISKMSCREKICGFLSGKDELANWEKSDLFQFYYDTKAIYGKLDFILPLTKKENVKQAVLIGGCNIYHACCHNIIHEKSLDILKALFKQAVFVLQAKYFYDAENYVSKKKELIDKLEAEDKHILELYFTIKSADKTEEFDNYSNELFVWSSRLIKDYSI